MHIERKEKGRFVGGAKKTLNRDNHLHSHECSQLYLEVAQIKFWEHMRPKRSQFRALLYTAGYLQRLFGLSNFLKGTSAVPCLGLKPINTFFCVERASGSVWASFR